MKRVKERSRNEQAEVSRSTNNGPASAPTYAGCFGDAIKSMSQTLTGTLDALDNLSSVLKSQR
jgi:hypothetical protein